MAVHVGLGWGHPTLPTAPLKPDPVLVYVTDVQMELDHDLGGIVLRLEVVEACNRPVYEDQMRRRGRPFTTQIGTYSRKGTVYVREEEARDAMDLIRRPTIPKFWVDATHVRWQDRQRVDHCPATGKVRHTTRRSAQDALDRTARANFHKKRRTEVLRVYRCPYCGDYHTGRHETVKHPYRRHEKHKEA